MCYFGPYETKVKEKRRKSTEEVMMNLTIEAEQIETHCKQSMDYMKSYCAT